jgi:AraC-like DNA-binding protein
LGCLYQYVRYSAVNVRIRAKRFEFDSLMRFVRECQVAAGVYIPPINTPVALHATWVALHSTPANASVTLLPVIATLVLGLARQSAKLQPFAASQLEEIVSPTDRAVHGLNYLIARHTDRTLTLTELAAFVNCTPRSISQLIREESGFRVVTHLSGLRTLTAASALALDVPIKHVALASGYHHTAELDRDFRKWLSATPTHFRLAARRQIDLT